MAIADTEDLAVAAHVQDVDGAWVKSEKWGDHEFAAGYMLSEEAVAIIERCAAEYRGQVSQ